MIHNFRSMAWYQRRSLALVTEVDMVPLFCFPPITRSIFLCWPAASGTANRTRLVSRSPQQTTGHCARRLTERIDVPNENAPICITKNGGVMKTLDRLEFMRLFVRIAESGSLKTAAQTVGVPQPTASHQLRQVESLPGVKPVRRSTYDLGLTDAGTRFLSRHRQIAGCPLCASNRPFPIANPATS